MRYKFSINQRAIASLMIGLGLFIFTLIPSFREKLSQMEFEIQGPWLDDRTPSPKVVPLIISDNDLKSLGSWPWNREIFALVNDKLYSAGAKCVAYDILFLDPTDDDVFLSASIQKHPKTTLAAYHEDGFRFVDREIGWLHLKTDVEKFFSNGNLQLPVIKPLQVHNVGLTNAHRKDQLCTIPLIYPSKGHGTYLNLYLRACLNWADIDERQITFAPGDQMSLNWWFDELPLTVPLNPQSELRILPHGGLASFSSLNFTELLQELHF